MPIPSWLMPARGCVPASSHSSRELIMHDRKMNPTRHLATSLVASLMCLSLAAHAQESANADLDACVKEQQIVLTAKGAGMGALAGLGTALFSKNKDALKNAAIGALLSTILL